MDVLQDLNDGPGTGAGPDEQPTRDPAALASRWRRAIERAEGDFKPWRQRADRIVKLYADQSKEADQAKGKRRFAMLWANTSTLQPAVYARLPQPEVSRRFKDSDHVARVASELMERCLGYTFDCEDVDSTLRSVRDDFLLTARGCAWVRYDAEIVQKVGDDGQPYEDIGSERVVIEHLHRDELVHPQAQSWAKLPWIARKVFMTREELLQRFGTEIGAAVPLDHRPENADENDRAGQSEWKATVYEVWSKVDRTCLWVSKQHPVILEESEPLLDLKGFFPCPRPCYGTLTTDNLTPIPDYVFYQDQSEEINDLTARIGALSDALKLVGFYPANASESTGPIQLALQAGTENQLVPVPSWAAFQEKGGVAQIQWLPVDQVAKIIQQCIALRKELVSDIYQITGISDIARGDTDPRETAKAQGLKAQWGSLRIRDRQAEMARFVRDLARIAGEVIADRFQPATLMAMANMPLPSDAEIQAQMAAQAQAAALQQAIAAARPRPMMPGMGGPAPMMAPPGPVPMPPQAPPPGAM